MLNRENRLSRKQFAWQDSASEFSVSKSDVDKVCKYILEQPKHHRKITFTDNIYIRVRYVYKILSENFKAKK